MKYVVGTIDPNLYFSTKNITSKCKILILLTMDSVYNNIFYANSHLDVSFVVHAGVKKYSMDTVQRIPVT